MVFPMKNILTLLIFMSCVFLGGLQAQTMAFAEAAQDTFKLPANATDFLELEFRIVNLSSDTLEVTAERTVNDTAPGHGTFFCWDICYGFAANQSISFIEILPGDTTDITYITFEPMGVNGVTRATMEFVNLANRETLTRTFVYQVGELTSIGSGLRATEFSLPYPSPAQDVLFVDVATGIFAEGARLELWSLAGKRVYTQALDHSQITQKLSTKDLASGHYFLHLCSGKQVMDTRKVFVAQK